MFVTFLGGSGGGKASPQAVALFPEGHSCLRQPHYPWSSH